MNDKIESLFNLFSRWLVERWPDVAGAKIAIDGQNVVFAVQSKKEGFDWDFVDTLCDLDTSILTNDNYNELRVDTISLMIFEHYVHTHLENKPEFYEFDGKQWNQMP